MDYIFVAKESSHKCLYEEIRSLEQLGEVETLRRMQGIGKNLGNEPTALSTRRVTFRTAFVTNHLITMENVEALVEAGRCRWKIENEDFNTLKTKGYHFEHNFGHGKQYLAQTLLSLNILAFLFHTVLELLDKRCAAVRQMLPRRDTFFQHIAALTQYLLFADWQSLLEFMLRGLRDGPGPPPQSFPIKL